MLRLKILLLDFKQNKFGSFMIVLLIALSTALSISVSMQERAFREGSARAADKFDLVIGGTGSDTQLVLSTVFLQPAFLPLIPTEIFYDLEKNELVEWAAPLAFGDYYNGIPIIGTTETLLVNNSDKKMQGTIFDKDKFEAVVGARSGLDIGDKIIPMHGQFGDNDHHSHDEIQYTVVGILPMDGSVWDKAIFVPLEKVWQIHDHDHDHDHDHAHDHQHSNSHDEHEHDHDHAHDHQHSNIHDEHEHDHDHAHDHQHSNIHDEHDHAHDHQHSNSHDEHEHDHDHAHDHQHSNSHDEHEHDHDHAHDHQHCHSHDEHEHDHDHAHDHQHGNSHDEHEHDHDHDHAHDHNATAANMHKHDLGISAIIVKPKSFAGAYQLRGKYKTDATAALFPAEVLVKMYSILGDTKEVLTWITIATQILIAISLIMICILYLRQKQKQIAAWRIFGAPRYKILLFIWSGMIILIGLAIILGSFIGYGLTTLISSQISAQSGFILPVSFSIEELRFVSYIFIVAIVMALIPSLILYKQSPIETLRSTL